MKLLNSNKPKVSYKLIYDGQVIGNCKGIIFDPPFQKIVLKTVTVCRTITTGQIVHNIAAIPFDLVQTFEDGCHIKFHDCDICGFVNFIRNGNELTFDTLMVRCYSFPSCHIDGAL